MFNKIDAIKGVINNFNINPYAKKNKAKVLLRIFLWQIKSRLKNNITVTWINNLKVNISQGDTGFTGNIYYGLQDYDDMLFTVRFLGNNDLFIDIGANCGSYSILASKVSEAEVIAFEPNTATFLKLKKNIELNYSGEKIQLRKIGISNKIGQESITINSGPKNFIVDHSSKENTELIGVSTLNAELQDLQPTFLKIDVEGHEIQVLEGATEILKNKGVIVVIIEANGMTERYGYSDNYISNFVKNFGFTQCVYDRDNNKVRESSNIIPGNTIFIRSVEFVNTKLQNGQNKKIDFFTIKI
jgi:FkbM family methyltransferase